MNLVDKMCKYEMDPARIAEDTQHIPFCPQTDGQMEGQMDNVKLEYPPSTLLKGSLMLMILRKKYLPN